MSIIRRNQKMLVTIIVGVRIVWRIITIGSLYSLMHQSVKHTIRRSPTLCEVYSSVTYTNGEKMFVIRFESAI